MEEGDVPFRLFTCGGVAQLGEHLPCKQGVRSSTLLISTTPTKVGHEAKAEHHLKTYGLIAQLVRAHD